MTPEQVAQIKSLIKITLEDTTRIWEDKSESHAYLVGYLQGALRSIASTLDK